MFLVKFVISNENIGANLENSYIRKLNDKKTLLKYPSHFVTLDILRKTHFSLKKLKCVSLKYG